MIISHKYKFIFVKTTKVGGTSLELFLNNICEEEDTLTPHWHPEDGYNPRNYISFFNPFPEILKRIYHEKRLKNCAIENTLSELFKKERYFEPMPAWQMKCRISSKIWNSYYKFTIERNPWDKAVSRYFHSKEVYERKYNQKLTFDRWFDYLKNRLRTPWVTKAWGSEAPYNYPRYTDPWTNEILVDKICRYESLEQELSEIFLNLGIPFNGELNYKAKSHYRKDKGHYSEFLTEKQGKEISILFEKEIQLMNYKF